MSYEDFIVGKSRRAEPCGIDIDTSAMSDVLFPFQASIVRWAINRGNAAIFAGCGLGKTIMQLEWAHHVAAQFGPVLLLTPLAVTRQTEREATRFGYNAKACDDPCEMGDADIIITNYEKLDRFDPAAFAGVVLDESSILKSYTGKFRNALIERFSDHRFRLACTATPSPNDVMELGNHAEFVGAMSRTEMLAAAMRISPAGPMVSTPTFGPMRPISCWITS